MDNYIRSKLVEAAKAGTLIYYMELGIGRGKKLGETLGAISDFEHEQDRPLLSAIVVSKVKGMPNPGFWGINSIPKNLTERECSIFWARELVKVLDWWKNHPNQQ